MQSGFQEFLQRKITPLPRPGAARRSGDGLRNRG
jgi:hypothetical protein